MAKKAQIGKKFQNLFFHSLSAPICAGLPQFEEKIQRNKKVMAQSCQDNDISGAPYYLDNNKFSLSMDDTSL